MDKEIDKDAATSPIDDFLSTNSSYLGSTHKFLADYNQRALNLIGEIIIPLVKNEFEESLDGEANDKVSLFKEALEDTSIITEKNFPHIAKAIKDPLKYLKDKRFNRMRDRYHIKFLTQLAMIDVVREHLRNENNIAIEGLNEDWIEKIRKKCAEERDMQTSFFMKKNPNLGSTGDFIDTFDSLNWVERFIVQNVNSDLEYNLGGDAKYKVSIFMDALDSPSHINEEQLPNISKSFKEPLILAYKQKFKANKYAPHMKFLIQMAMINVIEDYLSD